MRKVAPPIDRGWAWMVLLGAHMVNLLMNGGYKSLGMLFVEFRNMFQESAAVTAMMFGIIQGGTALFSPLATAIGERIGHRYVVMTGGVICATASFVTAFAPDMTFVAVVFGGLTAVGYGCMFSPTMVTVGQYFDKRRSVANGIAMAGGSMGTLLIPLLMRYVTDIYGFRGSLIIFAGCLLHMVVGGALFRPLSLYGPPSSKQYSASYEGCPMTEENLGSRHIVQAILPPDPVPSGDKLGNSQLLNSQIMPIDHMSESGSEDVPCWLTVKASLPCRDKSLDHVKPLFDWTILSNLLFLIYLIGIILSHPGYVNCFIFLPAYADELGLTKQTASIILAMSGVSDLLGCVVGGWFADLNLVKRHNLMATCLLIAGSASIIGPLFPSIYSISFMIGAVGLFGGCYFALIPVVLVDYVGLEKMPNALGLTVMFIGLSNTALPSILGYIKDISDFGVAFQVCGAMLFTSAFLFYSTPIMEKLEEKRRNLIEHKNKENVC